MKVRNILVCLFLLFSAVCPLSAMAEDNTDSYAPLLIVDLQNDEHVDFQLACRPKVTFQDGCLIVTSAEFEMQEQSIKASDIRRIRFYEYQIPTNINGVGKSRYSVRFVNGKNIVISGINVNPRVAVYSVSGVQQQAEYDYDGENLNVKLQSLPKGLYIIKVNDKSIKVHTR